MDIKNINLATKTYWLSIDENKELFQDLIKHNKDIQIKFDTGEICKYSDNSDNWPRAIAEYFSLEANNIQMSEEDLNFIALALLHYYNTNGDYLTWKTDEYSQKQIKKEMEKALELYNKIRNS